MIVVLLNVPTPRSAFHFGPLRPTDWVVAIAAGVAGVTWFEIYKTRLPR